MGYMLETRGLTKRFGRGDQAQDAVADVSLHIREGEVYGLLGPNGAGKSTTLKMICGMLRPTAGEILFAGHAWRREDLYAIGSLIEEAPLYPNLTARLGMLAGIFCPLAAQLVGGFAWSLMPLPQLFPPSASMVIPTSFIPVLPSGEPLAADMALGGALAADGMLTLAGLAVCALAFAALTAAGAAWFARSEER